VTTAPEAKRRIRDLIAARPALAGIPVRYGKATREAQVAREMLWLGAIQDGTIEWAALGQRRQTEDYTIGLTALKETAGDNPDAEYQTEQRATELLSEMRQALQGDPTLNGLLAEGVTFEAGSIATDPIAEPAGWLSIAQIRVRCVARVLASS
jgi:hypothetical protein